MSSRSAVKPSAAIVGIVAGLICLPAKATTTATWLSAVSGNWTDPTKWSSNPSYPNNENTNVQIEAGGSPYVVSLNEESNAIYVDDLDLNAEVDIPDSADLIVTGVVNLGSAGVIRLVGQQNILEIDGGAVNGEGEITFDGSYPAEGGNVDFGVNGGQTTCTFGSGITLATGTGSGGIGGTLINDGTILAENGHTLGLTLQSNSGDVEANTGGTISLGESWTNTGTISADGGTIISNVPTVSTAGNFQVLSGGFEFLGPTTTVAAVDALNIQNSAIIVGLYGTVNNTGTTLNVVDGTNTWHLIGAVNGGTIYAPPGVPLEVENVGPDPGTATSSLSDVQVNADIVMDSDAELALNSGTVISDHTVQMNGAFLAINPGVILSNGTTIILGGASEINDVNTGSVSAGEYVVTSSGGGTLGNLQSTLTNSGSIASVTPGYSLTLSATGIVNHGLLEASGATIVVPMGYSNVDGPVPNSVSSDGSIDLEAGGSMDITGTYSQLSSGIAEFQLDGTGAGQSGLLEATGNIQLGGELLVELTGGYQPNLGDQFQIVSSTGGTISGTFGSIVLDTGGQNFSVSYGPSSVILTAIPEPGGTLLLIGAGALTLPRRLQRMKRGCR